MYALDILDLHKTYSNGLQALKGIDLQITRGDFFGLLGPNGAGKSTLIGIVTSLVNKSNGTVRIMGYDIVSERSQAKSLIGLVPQEINLAAFEKVIDIVVNQAGFYGVARKAAYNKAEEYLNALGLWDKRNEISKNLSGGMKRRLMIARALAHEPEILILDEPTAGVDVEIRHHMWNFLTTLNKSGKTILLTSHYLEEIERLCKNIAIINNGKIIESDSVANVVSRIASETYIIELDNQDQRAISNLNGFNIVDAKTVEITVGKDFDLGTHIALLMSQGFKINSIRNKQNRLEELFLQIIKNNQK